MLERNLFDEAARVLAMPIPRRKALKYVAAGFAGALLSLLWPKRARAYDLDKPCGANCGSCINDSRCSRHMASTWTILVRRPGGKLATAHKSAIASVMVGGCTACCHCVAGPPPDAPNIADIPDVAITREGSLAAGNCQEGTDWVASWFPGRHPVSAREAAAEAIARGKPRLAREIARTGHLVHRRAQV